MVFSVENVSRAPIVFENLYKRPCLTNFSDVVKQPHMETRAVHTSSLIVVTSNQQLAIIFSYALVKLECLPLVRKLGVLTENNSHLVIGVCKTKRINSYETIHKRPWRIHELERNTLCTIPSIILKFRFRFCHIYLCRLCAFTKKFISCWWKLQIASLFILLR